MGKFKPTYDVGFEGTSASGECFKVIKYEGRKKITIEFSCGLKRNTTSTDIKQGKVKYSTKKVDPYKVGDEVTNRDCSIKGEIVSIDIERQRYKILFANGNIKDYSKSSILSRDITDVIKIKVGDIYQTNNYGSVKVVDYIDALTVYVQFEDDVVSKVQASSLRAGNIGHPKSGLPEGHTFTNNDGFEGTVIKFNSYLDIGWWNGRMGGGVSNHNANSIKTGSAYYPNFKSVVGVGYFGFGKYKHNKGGRNHNYNERVFKSWQRMIRRCYDEKEQLKPSSAAYKNVKVCEEWHNFQNFALWAEDKESKFTKGWELDKDLFGNGMLYCLSYCSLLPSKINTFLSDSYSNKKSCLPEGVTVIVPKEEYPRAKTGYVARCHINGKREYLGFLTVR